MHWVLGISAGIAIALAHAVLRGLDTRRRLAAARLPGTGSLIAAMMLRAAGVAAAFLVLAVCRPAAAAPAALSLGASLFLLTIVPAAALWTGERPT